MIPDFLEQARNVLLVSPPVYDFRLEWPQWHQPLGLLQIGTWLLENNKDVKLIDCLHSRKTRLPRQKKGVETVEGYTFQRWHFGLTYPQLAAEIRSKIVQGWKPDTVLVTSLNTIWWESARDTIQTIRQVLPDAKIVLGGAYPNLYEEHACAHGGADAFTQALPEVSFLPPKLSLYQLSPFTTGIYFYANQSANNMVGGQIPRSHDEVISEVVSKIAQGVREFAFFDEMIRNEHLEEFGGLLERLGAWEIDARIILPGNISPRGITESIAKQMARANVRQVYFHYDLVFEQNTAELQSTIADYQQATDLLVKHAGIKPRDGSIAAMVVVGLPYEDLERISESIIQLAHTVGSVMLVPFQYVPGLHMGGIFEQIAEEVNAWSPERLNSKLFPLARLTGKPLEEYLELTRLTALLNSKYRSRTFDFLGESLAAQTFRESIRSKGWDPFAGKSGTEQVDEIPLRAIATTGIGNMPNDR